MNTNITNKYLKLSRFGLLGVGTFVILSFFSRFLFPFGDEPDWEYQASRLFNGYFPFWSPYSFFQTIISKLSIDANSCLVKAGAMSIWAYIPNKCNETLGNILIRWIILVFSLLPLFVAMIYRNFFIDFMNVMGCHFSNKEWNKRLDTLVLTIIFPGMIFYLGVFSQEQFFLIVALYLFLFFGNIVLIAFLLFLLFSIDLGNALVCTCFIFSMVIMSYVRKHYERTIFFCFMGIILIFAYQSSFNLVNIFSILSGYESQLGEKAEIIFSVLANGNEVNKYPVILRPVITFMTSIFMTPSGLKVPFLYIVVFILISINILKLLSRKNNESVVNDIYIFVPLYTVLFTVFMLPTYVNAKYYIFMIPFWIYAFLSNTNKYKLYYLFLFFVWFVFLSLVVYRL